MYAGEKPRVCTTGISKGQRCVSRSGWTDPAVTCEYFHCAKVEVSDRNRSRVEFSVSLSHGDNLPNPQSR